MCHTFSGSQLPVQWIERTSAPEQSQEITFKSKVTAVEERTLAWATSTNSLKLQFTHWCWVDNMAWRIWVCNRQLLSLTGGQLTFSSHFHLRDSDFLGWVTLLISLPLHFPMEEQKRHGRVSWSCPLTTVKCIRPVEEWCKT